jgi:hypothetical protein
MMMFFLVEQVSQENLILHDIVSCLERIVEKNEGNPKHASKKQNQMMPMMPINDAKFIDEWNKIKIPWICKLIKFIH